MLKPADQRTTDVATTRTAVVQPLQPKKTASTSARKNKGEQTSKQARVLSMLRAPVCTEYSIHYGRREQAG